MIEVECAVTGKLFLIPIHQIIHIKSATKKEVIEYCVHHHITDREEEIFNSTRAILTMFHGERIILITNYITDLSKKYK